MSIVARVGGLGAAVVACLACSCSVHGIVHAPAAGAAGGTALRAAFAVPEVGEAPLRAPLGLTTSDGSGLAIASLTARVRVHGPLVETELTLVFSNDEPRTREGRFRIALPQRAFVSRLAMKIDGRLREAEVAEVSRAREVYDDIVHRRRDPLLVEQHGSNELSARVFPIDPSEQKTIVVGWTAEASAESPVTVPLRGLPSIGSLDVVVEDASGQLAAVRAANVIPVEDVVVAPRSPAAAVRAGELLITRVTVPGGNGATQPLGSGLLVLVDTSASRAPDLDADIQRIGDVIAALAVDEPDANLTVAAFDQSVDVVYRGSLTRYSADANARLRAHGALGASDLAGALSWAADGARATGARRLLLVGDGLATGGAAGADAMRARTKLLRGAGVTRLDVIAEGDVRDESTLRALAVGSFADDGVVVDASSSSRSIASRLTRPVLAPLPVSVRGARWVWPSSLRGAQPGDERVVYAEAPAGASSVRLGEIEVGVGRTDGAAMPRALVDKAFAEARVESLVAEGDRDGFTDELRAKIVALAKAKHVPSPFTSFLVVESESDRAALLAPRARPSAPARPSTPALALAAPPPRPSAPAPAPAPAPASAPATDDFFSAPPPLPPPPSGARHVAQSGSHVAKPVSIRLAMCIVNGRLPPESVQWIVRQNAGRIRACHEEGLRRRGPTLVGRVATRFVIDRDGSVRDAQNAESEIADDKVVSCITAAFASLRFPPPEGGVVYVVYPFVLRAPGAPAVEDDEATTKARLPDHAVNHFPWGGRLPSPPPPSPLAWSSSYAEVRDAFARSDLEHAFAVASGMRARDAQDVIALLALGEAYERAELPELAARAYGSVADLHPNDAAMLGVAAAHLERIGSGKSPLALELLRRASEDRADQPHRQHSYATALLRNGAYEEAFDVLSRAIQTPYAARFVNARLVLEDDLALVAAAWRSSEPARAPWIDARTAALTGPSRILGPSVSFVLSWETDMSDVELYVREATPSRDASALLGSQRASASEGFGPEAVTLTGARGARPNARLGVRLARKGPMGNVIGVVHVLDHDGAGHVAIRSRPFVVMNDGADVDLGPID